MNLAAALLASETNRRSYAACHVCEQGHETLKCPKFERKSVDKRWQLVRESRLCFNFLKPANTFHYSSVCRQLKCKVEGCGRRHHTILHGDWDPTAEEKGHTTLSGFVASYNSKMQQTLLQTGTAMLVSDGFQRAPVRFCFTQEAKGLISPRRLPNHLPLMDLLRSLVYPC